MCKWGWGGCLCLLGTLPSETALSSPLNNGRHDSHTVPLQLANCVCAAPPALRLMSVMKTQDPAALVMVKNNNTPFVKKIKIKALSNINTKGKRQVVKIQYIYLPRLLYGLQV